MPLTACVLFLAAQHLFAADYDQASRPSKGAAPSKPKVFGGVYGGPSFIDPQNGKFKDAIGMSLYANVGGGMGLSDDEDVGMLEVGYINYPGRVHGTKTRNFDLQLLTGGVGARWNLNSSRLGLGFSLGYVAIASRYELSRYETGEQGNGLFLSLAAAYRVAPHWGIHLQWTVMHLGGNEIEDEHMGFIKALTFGAELQF